MVGCRPEWGEAKAVAVLVESPDIGRGFDHVNHLTGRTVMRSLPKPQTPFSKTSGLSSLLLHNMKDMSQGFGKNGAPAPATASSAGISLLCA
jgi:hypothetical protein